MSRKIVAGNWKMNLNMEEGCRLVEEIMESNLPEEVDVMIFPSHTLLSEVSKTADNRISVGIQNFNDNESGAYTGETSVSQAISAGAQVGLIGHSERRTLFGEDNAILKAKVNKAIEKGFAYIFCCGEPLEERENGSELDFVRKQLDESLFHIDRMMMKECIIAYEPVWAIGTGKTATSLQAEEMHHAIRSWIEEKYDKETAEAVTILYGGSCNPGNASELFSCANVDGGLIGGASLKSDSFIQIINAF